MRTFINPETGSLEFAQDYGIDYFPLATTSASVLIADSSLTLPRPIFRTTPSYQSVNNDPELRKKMTKYFFQKLQDDWLYASFGDVAKYLTVVDNKVTFSKSLSEMGKNGEMTIEKVKFIVDEVFTKHDLLEVIDKYVRRRNVNWYDLKTKHKADLRDYIHGKLKNHMRKLIANN
jgi:hypothetical protein